VTVMSALADFAVVAIENARLYSTTLLEHQKLETMLRNVADGVIMVDTQNETILINDSARQIFNLESPDLEGVPFREIIPNPELRRTIEDKTQKTPFKIEIKLDEDRYIVAQVTPIPGIGKMVTLQDITHFKKLDIIKSDFVHTVSHDLRSPLTAILGYIDMLERVGELNDRQRSFISRVQTSVHDITDLINALLELGKIEAGLDQQREAVPLQNVVKNAVDNLRPLVKESQQELILEVPESLPPVFGNQVRLQQVVNNLVENANKYTPAGGMITIRARSEGSQVILQVQDSGVGIPAADQPYIFDKLYRASNVPQDSPGSGLGLSIVKSIVDHHKGRLWFESSPEKGTTFTVVLPAAFAPP